MKNFAKLLCGIAAAVAFAAAQASADSIVFYSFNTNGFVSGNVTSYVSTANIGSSISSFSTFHTNTAATPTILSGISLNNSNGMGVAAVSGNSVSQNGWDSTSAFFQFTLNSTGWENLVLSWASNKSSTGPTNMVLQYSSNGGGAFSDFGSFLQTANSAVFTADLSAVSEIENNSGTVFRFVAQAPLGVIAGTWKIDNFTIDATAVIPEPSTVLLVGAGLAGLLAIRRRRS